MQDEKDIYNNNNQVGRKENSLDGDGNLYRAHPAKGTQAFRACYVCGCSVHNLQRVDLPILPGDALYT